MSEPLLAVTDLSVAFRTDEGEVTAVDRVSFSVSPGEVLGIVGESGSGKSVSALAVMGLLPKPGGRVTSGEILFEGEDLLKLPERRMRGIRGRRIGMIFQEPMTSLNPVFTIGDQIAETIVHHERIGLAAARERAVDMLARVGIPSARKRLDDYPHQLSGGMRQRVAIALATVFHPSLIIADEPTTALDVVVQRGVLQMLKEIQSESANTVLLVTHDLAVHANVADRVGIMYAGRIVEEAPTSAIFQSPRHPYTAHLIRSLPSIGDKTIREGLGGAPPNLASPPNGCRFHPRCPLAIDRCRTEVPPLTTIAPQHRVACPLVAEAG
jgi:oligopeptide/dipeptide ABC transporter ATP-binding protein